jgi:hypothetical protein
MAAALRSINGTVAVAFELQAASKLDALPDAVCCLCNGYAVAGDDPRD